MFRQVHPRTVTCGRPTSRPLHQVVGIFGAIVIVIVIVIVTIVVTIIIMIVNITT